jgi:hypothetical protein
LCCAVGPIATRRRVTSSFELRNARRPLTAELRRLEAEALGI